MPSQTVTCPACETNLKIPDTIPPGKKIRCPRCSAIFVVQPEEEPLEEAVQPRPGPARSAAPKPAPAPRKARSRRDEEDEEDDRRAVDDEEAVTSRPARKSARARDDWEDEEEDDRPAPRKGRREPARQNNALVLWGFIGGLILVLGGGAAAMYFLVFKKDEPKPAGPPFAGNPNVPPVNVPGVNQPPLQGAVWTANPQLVNQLAPEVPVQAYRIRPPKGYNMRLQNAPNQSHGFSWQGPMRPDTSAGNLSLLILNIPPQERLGLTVDRFLGDFSRGMLMPLKATVPDIAVGPSEYGQVNGMTFLRARITGSNKVQNFKVHGFVYVALDGDKGIALAALEREANRQALDVSEAAALTFKKP